MSTGARLQWGIWSCPTGWDRLAKGTQWWHACHEMVKIRRSDLWRGQYRSLGLFSSGALCLELLTQGLFATLQCSDIPIACMQFASELMTELQHCLL